MAPVRHGSLLAQRNPQNLHAMPINVNADYRIVVAMPKDAEPQLVRVNVSLGEKGITILFPQAEVHLDDLAAQAADRIGGAPYR